MKMLLLVAFLSAGMLAGTHTKAQSVEDKYPVTLLNATGGKQLLFYITGDGGVNNFSENLCDKLVEKNYPVVVINAKKYFWKQKLPDVMASDFSEIIKYYLQKLNKKEFSVIGYSFGADAASFLNNRLPKALQNGLKYTVLLSPSMATDFTIKLADLFGISGTGGKYATLPEVLKTNSKILSVFGDEEDRTFYSSLVNKKNITAILIPGSHKYNNDVQKLISTITPVL